MDEIAALGGERSYGCVTVRPAGTDRGGWIVAQFIYNLVGRLVD